MRLLRFPAEKTNGVTSQGHLTAPELAAFIDRSLAGAAREQAASHLADCPQCREELADCSRLAASAPKRALRWRIGAAFSSAAAALILAVVLRAGTRSHVGAPSVERGLGVSPGGVRLVAPLAGSDVAARDVRFVWRADSAAVGYRIVITTLTGLVWDHEVRDTSIAPPRDLTFVNGGVYYWRVESSRGDGSQPVSSTERFQIIDR
jgi:anti-sigma factor RsiW